MTETSSSDSNSEQTSDDIIVDEVDEISFEEVDPSDEVIDYYWTTVQETSNWERPDVEPLQLTKYSINKVGLLQLGFNKPIIDPPLIMYK